MTEKCIWLRTRDFEGDEVFKTKCECEHYIDGKSVIAEKSYSFCPYCGNRIEERIDKEADVGNT